MCARTAFRSRQIFVRAPPLPQIICVDLAVGDLNANAPVACRGVSSHAIQIGIGVANKAPGGFPPERLPVCDFPQGKLTERFVLREREREN